MRNSLTVRLALTSGAWTVATLVLAGVMLTWLFRAHIERRFDEQLFDHLEENIAASEIDSAGRLALTWTPADPRFGRPLSGWYWAVMQDSQQVARSRSLWRNRLDVLVPRSGTGPSVQELVGPGDVRLRAAVEDITLPESNAHFTFIVAGPRADVDRDVGQFTRNLVATLTMLGIGLLGVMLLQVRFGLQPLRTLRRSLARVRAGTQARLAQNHPAEVEPLVRDLNALLDHNAALVDRARTQSGNLAHALKNPLTVIINEATRLPPEQRQLITEQAASMKRHIERYLSRARAAGSVSVPGAATQVDTIVEDLSFSLDRLYKDKGLAISVRPLRSLYFRGDAGDLEEMLGNLMDNACKWARHRVEVSGRRVDGRLLLSVDDDGPGVSETERAHILERGRRLDQDAPGSGLGLGIVRDLAELYLGSVSLTSSSLGGMQARLELPAVQCDA